MKKVLFFLAMALTCAFATAQTNQVVWLNGKVLYGHPITTIDSMTYDMNGMMEGDTLHLIMPRSTMYVVHDTVIKTIKDTVYIDVCGSGVATVSTSAVTHATYNSLALGGTVRFSDYDAITERGICYATHSEPTTADNVTKAGKGTGTFSITITGLTPQTTYYLRAYAVNESGTAYGDEIAYTTPEKENTGGGSTGTEGSLVGKFSVSSSKQVSFSKGNLQYQASTNTWRFAENQTDYIGGANSNISATYDGWIDLFGWGTSGYDNTANDPLSMNYQPWATSTMDLNKIKTDSTQNCEMLPIIGECSWDYTYLDASNNTYGYGPSYNMTDRNLTGSSANYDWGVYNAISNGGNRAGMWRTLTSSEWNYLFNSRTNAQYLWSQGTVNGVCGMIILPDNFSKPASISWTPKANSWSTNTYTSEQWATLQAIGAVFPACFGLPLRVGCELCAGPRLLLVCYALRLGRRALPELLLGRGEHERQLSQQRASSPSRSRFNQIIVAAISQEWLLQWQKLYYFACPSMGQAKKPAGQCIIGTMLLGDDAARVVIRRQPKGAMFG